MQQYNKKIHASLISKSFTSLQTNSDNKESREGGIYQNTNNN
jgi:hypothetical protein